MKKCFGQFYSKNLKKENDLVITNPTYLYKVPAKKLNYNISYFDLYKKHNRIWIVPSNIFFLYLKNNDLGFQLFARCFNIKYKI